MLLDLGTGRLGDIDTNLRDIECVDLLLCRRLVSFALDLIGMVASDDGGSSNGDLIDRGLISRWSVDGNRSVSAG